MKREDNVPLIKNKKEGVWFILFILSSIIIPAAGGFFLHISYSQMIGNAVVMLFASNIILFTFLMERIRGSLYYDNDKHFGRFLLTYFIGLLVSVIFPVLVPTAWLFPVFMTAVALFSGKVTGIVASSSLICVTSMLSGNTYGNIYLLYLLVGVFSIVMFSKPDEKFRIFLPLLSTISVLAVALVVQVVFCISGITTFESFVIPFVNLFVNVLLYIALLKLYSHMVVHKDREVLLVIGDQAYEAMKMLKEKDNDAYQIAVHTAYFAERIAPILEVNVLLVKCISYYQNFSKNKEEYQIYRDKFPIRMRTSIDEINEIPCEIHEPESAAVYLSAEVVKRVKRLIKEQPKTKLDINQIVDEVFIEAYQKNLWDELNISLLQLHEMKKLIIKEKMYFDFLK